MGGFYKKKLQKQRQHAQEPHTFLNTKMHKSVGRHMKNLKIRTRIALSLILPIVGLVLFSGTLVLEKRHTATEMHGLEQLSHLAPVISSLVHELQTERGTAAVFIGSKGKKYKQELPAQFTATDAKTDELINALHGFDASAFNTAREAPEPEALPVEDQAAMTPAAPEAEQEPSRLLVLEPGISNELVDKMNRAIEALDQIEKTRKKTLKRRLPVLKMAGYYTDTITKLLRSEERRVGKECRSRWSRYH